MQEILLKKFQIFNQTKSSLNWETLIEDCRAKVMKENSARAIEVFNFKYFRKIIQWKGFLSMLLYKDLIKLVFMNHSI